LGFDVIDLNADSLEVPEETLLRLIRIIKNERLKAKPLFGINFEKSAIPSKEDRAFGAYIAPTPKGSGNITIWMFLFLINRWIICHGMDAVSF